MFLKTNAHKKTCRIRSPTGALYKDIKNLLYRTDNIIFGYNVMFAVA